MTKVILKALVDCYEEEEDDEEEDDDKDILIGLEAKKLNNLLDPSEINLSIYLWEEKDSGEEIKRLQRQQGKQDSQEKEEDPTLTGTQGRLR